MLGNLAAALTDAQRRELLHALIDDFAGDPEQMALIQAHVAEVISHEEEEEDEEPVTEDEALRLMREATEVAEARVELVDALLRLLIEALTEIGVAWPELDEARSLLQPTTGPLAQCAAQSQRLIHNVLDRIPATEKNDAIIKNVKTMLHWCSHAR